MVIKPFDEKLDTIIFTDASYLFEVRYILVQVKRREDGIKQYRVIAAGPSSLTEHKYNYSIIELETMSFVYADALSRKPVFRQDLWENKNG